MKTFLILLFSALPLLGFSQVRPEWTGAWLDTLVIPQQARLPIIIHFFRTPEGDWKASMDSPSQMAYDLVADSVDMQGDSVTVYWKQAFAMFTAKYTLDGTLRAKWIQAGTSYPLTMRRANIKRTKQLRPQTPQPPYVYDTLDLKIAHKKAKVSLAGTLALPKGKAKAETVVILIAGSGPHDRDESILGHKPFKVWTDHLMRQNSSLAVFRYDKRGVGQSTGSYAKATTADFADDVEAIVAGLRKHPRLKAKRFVLIGHSEGGMVAPMVASRNKAISGIVLLAGPGEPIAQLMRWQMQQIASLEQPSAAGLAVLDSINALIFERIVQGQKLDPKQLTQEIKPLLAKINEADKAKMNLTELNLKTQLLSMVNNPWYLYFIRFKPEDYLKKVRCPVLALNGDRDIQVGPQNLGEIQRILEGSGHKSFRCEILPQHNHLFQTCQVCDLKEYATLEETLSAQTLKAVQEWLSELHKSK
jgi:pimeloyl-ACP methyl ester carboxylesterase